METLAATALQFVGDNTNKGGKNPAITENLAVTVFQFVGDNTNKGGGGKLLLKNIIFGCMKKRNPLFFVSIGLAIGAGAGVAMHNIALGAGIGTAIGAAFMAVSLKANVKR